MTVAEIKIQTLKLMEINKADISLENYPSLKEDENYKEYLSRMPASITRAMNRIKTSGAVPDKSYSYPERDKSALFAEYEPNTDIPDFSKLKRVALKTQYGYASSVPFMFEGTKVIVPNVKQGCVVTFIYEPKMPVITPITDDLNTEIPLPEELCSIIPYFVKADVFEQDEPALATQARNIFEAMLAEYQPQEQNAEQSIQSVYTQGW